MFANWSWSSACSSCSSTKHFPTSLFHKTVYCGSSSTLFSYLCQLFWKLAWASKVLLIKEQTKVKGSYKGIIIHRIILYTRLMCPESFESEVTAILPPLSQKPHCWIQSWKTPAFKMQAAFKYKGKGCPKINLRLATSSQTHNSQDIKRESSLSSLSSGALPTWQIKPMGQNVFRLECLERTKLHEGDHHP